MKQDASARREYVDRKAEAKRWTMMSERVSFLTAVVVAVVVAQAAGCATGPGPQDPGNLGPDKAEVATGKADGTDWCALYNLPADCDLCEEFGWYGDDWCDQNLIDDGICKGPDPDCPDEDEEEPASWDLTLEEVSDLTERLATATYGPPETPHHMGWAHYANNCFIRARAVYYYFTFGELPQYDETDRTAQQEMMERIRSVQHSPVYEITFEFAGTVIISGQFETDDVELQPRLQSGFEARWTNHVGALVYTDAGPRVVDVAFSQAPLTIEDWKRNFVPETLMDTCAMNDREATQRITHYRIMKSLGQDPPVPEPRCAFEIREIFRNEDGSYFDDNQLFPYMWNDVHEMEVSTDFVTHNTADTFYLMNNPVKVPLIRLSTTSVDFQD